MAAITGQPAYQQIADDLRAQITDGRLPVGEPLPSTANLMQTYGVSITAARAAVKLLQHEGLVIGQPGKGVYVHAVPEAAPPSVAEVAQQVAELTETVRRLNERVAALETARRKK